MENLDFLAIGDITNDAFIKLKDAHVVDSVDHVSKEICLSFGDKIPYEFVEVVKAVGNSANAAVSAARLGLSSALVANIGGDQNGKECIGELDKNSVRTEYIKINADKETNYHYVLWYNAERTILVKHQPFDYKFPEIKVSPRWIYLSSLGEHTEQYHQEIAQFLQSHPESKLAFQPGTFQMAMGTEALAKIYAQTEVLILNREEAERVLKTKDTDIKTLAQGLEKLGPKIVLITDGPEGAYLYRNNEVCFMPPYPDPKPAYERTGAGDAFASTFISALALGKSVEEALEWAPINSMSVVQYIGAQKGLLSQEKLLEFLAEAPVEYKIKKV